MPDLNKRYVPLVAVPCNTYSDLGVVVCRKGRARDALLSCGPAQQDAGNSFGRPSAVKMPASPNGQR